MLLCNRTANDAKLLMISNRCISLGLKHPKDRHRSFSRIQSPNHTPVTRPTKVIRTSILARMEVLITFDGRVTGVWFGDRRFPTLYTRKQSWFVRCSVSEVYKT